MFSQSSSKPVAHSLKWQLRGKGVTLYELKTLLGGSPSEGKLSRILNGMAEMPKELEEKITKIITQIN